MTFCEIWWAWFKSLSCLMLIAASYVGLCWSLVSGVCGINGKRRPVVMFFGVLLSLAGIGASAAWVVILMRQYGG